MSMAEDKSLPNAGKKEAAAPAPSKMAKPTKGLLSRIWNGFFRVHGDDFEKRLKHISKEEAAVLARMKRRSQTWRKMTRHFIVLALILEVIAVGYAVMTTRAVKLDWKMRVSHLLPMFFLPAFFFAAYSAYVRITRMCDRKDQNTLERLRAERQAKIDELKEKTNYYTTQQLIQRYDPDPAAKAAAATVLASKLGAESGLKVYVGDESNHDAPARKSNDVEVVGSSGLRNRKPVHARSSSVGGSPFHQLDDETPPSAVNGLPKSSEHNQLVVVNHQYPQGSATHDGGWLSRLAALLVGEDPTQSYALICGNCHMHNGLARKEDFPYITYYCPHCHALNRPKQMEEHACASGSPDSSSVKGAENGTEVNLTNTFVTDTVMTGRTPVNVASVVEEVSEKVTTRDLAS